MWETWVRSLGRKDPLKEVMTRIRTRHNWGDNRGHWICLSLWVSISSFTAWDQSLCSLPAEGTLLSLKETRTPQSGREYIRAAELDSEEVESQGMCRNKGVWETSDCGGTWKQFRCFFFFWLIYFNWRLITLQYCSGFCHTLT